MGVGCSHSLPVPTPTKAKKIVLTKGTQYLEIWKSVVSLCTQTAHMSKNKRIVVRVSEQEHGSFMETSQKSGLKLSSWVRSAMVYYQRLFGGVEGMVPIEERHLDENHSVESFGVKVDVPKKYHEILDLLIKGNPALKKGSEVEPDINWVKSKCEEVAFIKIPDGKFKLTSEGFVRFGHNGKTYELDSDTPSGYYETFVDGKTIRITGDFSKNEGTLKIENR